MTPKRKILPVFVPHWGCPHQCVFCNQNEISGTKKPASAEDVRLAVEEARQRNVADELELAFYGGSFTAIPEAEQESLLSEARHWKERGVLSAIRLSTRPDCIAGDTVSRLARYGVSTVELGSQSMDDEVLRLSGRGHTSADTEKAVRLLHEAGISVILQMMTGLPGDTPEKSLETARRLALLKPEGVRIYPTVVVKNTPLFAMWRQGEYREQTVEEAVELCSRLLEIFDREKIPVIRIGLNPTEELSHGGAVAGAYHPALGEMARSRLYRRRAETLLEGILPGTCAEVTVGKGKTSLFIGQRRENLLYLQKKFALRSIRVLEKDGAELTIRIFS